MRRTLALVVLLLTSAAACGEEDTLTMDATPAAIAHVAQDTLDGGTGRFESTMTVDVMGVSVTIDTNGVYDGPAGRSSITTDLGSLVEAIGDTVPGGELAGFGGAVEVITDGDAVFICSDLLAAFVGGTRCGAVDLGELAGAELPMGTIDPTSFVRILEGAEEVEDLGPEVVDGVETQHITGTYRLSAALDALGPDEAAELEASFERFGEVITDAELPFDVWVDGDGRIRRMVHEFEALGSSASIEQRYFDFGTDVDIQVPDDEEIVDLNEVLGRLGD